MFTKSQLEAMKFSELRRLAKEKNISRRWTCKREAIDHFMKTGQEEYLDMITVTLVDSPESTTSSCGPQVVSPPKQSATEAVRTTRSRSARSRFPKPRMTVFQQDSDSPVLKAESSHKIHQKYFATPIRHRKSKASENFSSSATEHAPEVVPSRNKKSLTHAIASTGAMGAMIVSRVTPRENQRPITRSYKNSLQSTDLLESSDEHYSDTAESSLKCNLNETFEIKNETLKLDISFPLEANIKEQNVQPDKLNNSTKKEGITTSPLKMEGYSRTSTPKDDIDDKENEISDSKYMNTTFELPCVSKERCASNVKNNKSGRRKRSSSCPRGKKDKDGHLKAVFFNPVAKLVASSESHLHPKRGTPKKSTKIPILVKNMPDFTNIHKKEFEKMESVVDCHQRKLERARTLFSPKAVKEVQPVMVFSAQPSETRGIPSKNPIIQRNELPLNQVINNIPRKAVGERNIFQRTQQHKGNVIQRNDLKQMVTNKLPGQIIRRAREDSRTVIRGVRLNRRFELQMAHRKLN